MTKRKMTEMAKRKMTDGERIAEQMLLGWALSAEHVHATSKVIDRLLRKRMAEAWKEGWIRAWETPRMWTGDVPGNPYRGSKRKV